MTRHNFPEAESNRIQWWLSRRLQARPGRWIMMIFLGCRCVCAQNQPMPPGSAQELDTAIGQRVEATAVLGTQNIASRIGLVNAYTQAGQAVAADGRYVNWNAPTISFEPSFQLQ